MTSLYMRTFAAVGTAALLSLATTVQAQATAPVAGGVKLGVAVTELDIVANGWSVKKVFLGHKVVGEEGKSIGNVEDLIVAPDRSVSYAILEVGGFLGMGEHRIAIPVDQFKMGPKDTITLPGATKDALKLLPKFVYSSKKS